MCTLLPADDNLTFSGEDRLWQQHKLLKPIENPQGARKPKERAPPVSVGKDSVSVLNELYHGPKYTISERTGEGQDGYMTASLTLEGQTWTGRGQSKKTAKADVATKAIDSLTIQGIFQVCCVDLKSKLIWSKKVAMTK